MLEKTQTQTQVDEWEEVNWYGLYAEKWRDEIVPEAASHPAKYSRALIRKIYEFSIEQGWLKIGDWIIDPFGGVALGGLDAMVRGINWVGVELEPRFVALGNGGDCDGVYVENGEKERIPFCGKKDNHEPHHVDGNIELWNRRYWGKLPNPTGTVILIQGDSRKLLQRIGPIMRARPLIEKIKTVVSGLPFQDSESQLDGIEMTEEGLDMAVSSPPYSDTEDSVSANKFRDPEKLAEEAERKYKDGTFRSHSASKEAILRSLQKANARTYGNTEGNLGNMKASEGDLNMAISSPPYADIPQSGGTRGLVEHGTGLTRGERAFDEYGESEGQLGRMEAGDEKLDMAISSPPYGSGLANAHNYRDSEKAAADASRDIMKANGGKAADMRYSEDPDNLGNLPTTEGGLDAAISSPPYANSLQRPGEIDPSKSEHIGGPHSQMNNSDTRYGDTEGQLGAIAEGDLDSVISSPPFLQTSGGTNVTSTKGPLSDPRLIQRHAAGNAATNAYGESEGQLSSMAEGDVDAVVSSPPFENQANGEKREAGGLKVVDRKRMGKYMGGIANYGNENGNLGNQTGEDFWSASRLILEQVYAALKPGAKAFWVTKGYIKAGRYVDFPDQWRRLCEAVGFKTTHKMYCWMIERKGTQLDLEGNPVEKVVQRKSFFRLMHERKGGPRVDYEVTWIMEK